MKRAFRFLLAFKNADGGETVAEFDKREECEDFRKKLGEQEIASRLINEKELQALLYRQSTYIDMRG